MKNTLNNFADREESSKAFTMLELVMVIVVLGIIATLALPRLDRDIQQELADNLLADFRHTQYLALNDYRHNQGNNNWQRSFWRIGFGSCTGSDFYEYIGSDTDYSSGDIADSEAASDPTNGNRMNWTRGSDCSVGKYTNVSSRIFISHKFGVQGVATTGSCAASDYVGFDHLGRPHTGFDVSATPDYSTLLQTACNFVFTLSDNTTITITIAPETGYMNIVGQDDS